jgi:hypothetical protein
MHRNGSSFVAALLSSIALGACVTINIYFPAAAAERAADRIIDEIWQVSPDSVKTPAGKADPAKSPATKPSAEASPAGKAEKQ